MKKLIFLCIFALIILCYAPVILHYTLDGFVQSDESMTHHFLQNRTAFDKLAEVINQYGQSGRICAHDLVPDSPFRSADLTSALEHLTTCQDCLKIMGSRLCSVVNRNGKKTTILVPVWSSGILSGPSKGYFYSSTEIANLIPNLNDFAKETILGTHAVRSTIKFKHIDEHWYLYYENN